MAVGSDPELGVSFSGWRTMTDQEQERWFAHVRSWGPNGVDGYGTLGFPDPARISHHHKNWNHHHDRTSTVDL